MSRRFTSAPKCEKCQKSVYFNEEVKDGERVYHKSCFRCTHCNKIVEPTSYSQYGGVIYCKPHFLALFRARGKYDDLSNGQPDAQTQKKQPSPVATSTFSSAAFQASGSPTNAPARGKKDLNSALRRRNAAEVEAFIEQRGLHVLFVVGADGVTPIETAFANNNPECGRVMLKYIKQALETKDFAWEKEFTEEVQESGDVRKAFEEPKQWQKTDTSEISDGLSKLKKVDRTAFENKEEQHQPNEIELRKSTLKAAKAEENTEENAQPQEQNQAELEPQVQAQQEQPQEQPQEQWQPEQPQEQPQEQWQPAQPQEQWQPAQPQEQPQEQWQPEQPQEQWHQEQPQEQWQQEQQQEQPQEQYYEQPQEEAHEQDNKYSYDYAQNEQQPEQVEAEAPVATAASDYTDDNQPIQSEYNYEASAY